MITPRPDIAHLTPVPHGGRHAATDDSSEAIHIRHDFSVCLNAFGPAEVVARAVAAARVDEYPDPYSRAVRAAAASVWNLPMDEIIFGAGAAELIHAACLAYLRAGDLVVVADPAFGEYARAAALCGARVHAVPLTGEGTGAGNFAEQVRRTRPRLVFAAAPISPTGAALTMDAVRTIADVCAGIDALLVLDQAFDAFTAEPLGSPALPGHSHVLHLRSLTKDHALAGVRAAVAMATPDVAAAVERVRVPWAASTAAQAAGVVAMSDDARAHVARTTRALRGEARRIAGACVDRGIAVSPSQTHFFLIECASATGTRDTLLAKAGILVRDCTSFGLPRHIRVAARTPSENDALIAAIVRHVQPVDRDD